MERNLWAFAANISENVLQGVNVLGGDKGGGGHRPVSHGFSGGLQTIRSFTQWPPEQPEDI